MQVFNKLEIDTSKDCIDVFDRFLNNMISTIESTELKKDPVDKIMIAEFVSNKDGKIKDGIRFLDTQKDSYYQIFKNSKIIKKEKVALENFQTIFSYRQEKYNSED